MHTENLNHQIEYYSSLLRKYFDESLSGAERSELAQWLRKDRRNRLLYRRIKSAHSLKAYYDLRNSIDPEKEYKLLVERYPEIREKRLMFSGYLRWVAALLLLALGTTTWYKYGNIRQVSEVKTMVQEEKVIAVLKTSDGEIVRLHGNNALAGQEPIAGMQIRDSLKELICEQIPLTDSFAMHTLVIPRGGEYKLILADGTKVWLNSESEIRFPGVFKENKREITLIGEAYLEVTHDAKRPFRVKAGGGIIEVLGTSFGISIYPEEQKWTTVLVNGSVKVKYGQNSLLLKPGREAFLKNGTLFEQQCDTDKELAWVNGLFIFEHDRLEEVVKKLSRWYNIEFRFDNERLRDYVFTGQVSRDKGIDRILDLIGRMNVVTFEKKRNYILIKEKAREF